jgi:hypothetical protein
MSPVQFHGVKYRAGPRGATSQVKIRRPTSGDTGLGDADVHFPSKESRHYDGNFSTYKIFKQISIGTFNLSLHQMPRSSSSSIIVEVQHPRIATSRLLIRSPTVPCINRLIINYQKKRIRTHFLTSERYGNIDVRCRVTQRIG